MRYKEYGRKQIEIWRKREENNVYKKNKIVKCLRGLSENLIISSKNRLNIIVKTVFLIIIWNIFYLPVSIDISFSEQNLASI